MNSLARREGWKSEMTIILYVMSLRFVHTLAPRAERRVNRVRLSVLPNDAAVLKSGIAVQAPLRTEAGITTIQILGPDGGILASMGVAEADGDRSQSEPIWNDLTLRRRLARANDHVDVWSVPLSRYRISRYGPDGEEKVRIERSADWFRPYPANETTDPYRAPADPSVVSMHQDADGLLWVAIVRAPASFSPVVDAPVGVEEQEPVDLSYFDLNRILSTTVEVLDPVAGELVARRDFDELVTFVSTPEDDVFIYSLHPDELGDLDCVIRPLSLRRE